jgi:meso-butanediol dehydrogenase / (S,S)-butanediol dehydrogenase / diacetyl reductase
MWLWLQEHSLAGRRCGLNDCFPAVQDGTNQSRSKVERDASGHYGSNRGTSITDSARPLDFPLEARMVEQETTEGQKVAVVTGAGHGIGRATSLRLAGDGFDIAAADINPQRARDVAEEVRSLGARAVDIVTDVGVAAQVKAMVDRAHDTFGRIDVLVNNAGMGHPARVHELDIDDWRRVIDVNLSSVYFGAKHTIPYMLERGAGTIVNIASVQGLVAHRRSAAYNAAKAGVINLTRNIAIDYGADGIRCNCVCPGHIRVRPRQETAAGMAGREIRYPDVRTVEELEAMHPLGRVGKPEEIADVVAYLVSPESSFINGAALVADGGLTAQVLA